MQHTSCTEDRIQHALDRCLDGLRSSEYLSQSWSTGWCMNRWSLEELLKRDPENFLILLQQILKRARQVQEECEYELVAPLSIMFKSTLLQTPYCPIECNLLVEACKVFHGFLTWPEPYSSVCHSVLTIVQQELRAPGISYHRLVKEEQGMSAERQRGKTITVLLLNPADVPQTFLSVVQQLSAVDVSQREISINLIKHAFQCSLGSKYHTHTVHLALQSLSDDDLSQTLSCVSVVLETAAMMTDPSAARAHVLTNLEEVRQKLQIPACNGATSNDMLQFLKLPTAKCYMIPWDTDNFDALSEILEREMELSLFSEEPVEEDEVDEEDADEDEEEDEEVEMGRYETDDFLDPRASMFSTTSSLSTASKDSMLSSSSDFSPVSTLSSSSQASGTDSDFCEDIEEDACALMPIGKNKNATALSKRLSRLFKPRGHSLCRAKSLGNTDCKDKKDFLPTARAKRSNSMPQQVLTLSAEPVQSDSAPVRPMCFRKRPILSSDEDEDMGTMLIRVMVFGADYVAGKLARAYTSLRNREKLSPRLTKHCRMKFFFIPVKRDPFSNTAASQTSTSPLKTVQDMNMDVYEDSTSNIAHLLGMLDPWYKRNTLCLLNLPMHVVCQQTFKPDSESVEESVEGCLPIMADLLLYYCRNAARPALIQLYQAELTLAGGETRTEVFIHSLELGHTAATRAIKAMGAASKRFGIDGDREAVPLSLEVVYNQVVISGRGQKTRAEKVCTSVNLTKVCRNQEELNPKLEFLQLTMTEVLKRQNSKSKRSYNQQLSVTQVKVDRFRVCGSGNTTFAVCLDQDEKKILQSVTRCEVSVCNKPDSSSDWMKTRPLSSQVDQTFYSLLCLPVCTFSGPQP